MGTIFLFVLLAIVPPFIFYMMMYGDDYAEKRYVHPDPHELNRGMSSASVLACMNKKRKSVAEGKQAFMDGVSLDACPYEDTGKNEDYNYLFNQNYHWKNGWKSNCTQKSNS